jgi:hypothetical protein
MPGLCRGLFVSAPGGRGLSARSCRAFQNQFQTSLMSQWRNVATAKGGPKYNTQVPCLWCLAMFVPPPPDQPMGGWPPIAVWGLW